MPPRRDILSIDCIPIPPEELTAIYSHYTNEQVDFNVAVHIRIERTPSLSVELKGFAPLPLPRIVFETIVSSIPPKLHIFYYALIIYQIFCIVNKIFKLYFNYGTFITLSLLYKDYIVYYKI